MESLKYYQADHLGNTRLAYQITHQNGVYTSEITNSIDYLPFGKVLREYNLENERFKFTGKERDNESGYDYFEARLYDSEYGRFLQVDPMGVERSSLSSFNFVSNNPIIRMDLSGMLDDYYIYSDGTIDKLETEYNNETYYYVHDNKSMTNLGSFEKNENGLIQLPSTYVANGGGVSFSFSVKNGQTDRAFVNPDVLSTLFGAFIETGFNDFTITQFSYSNGDSPSPSISHVDGVNGDFRYLRADQSGEPVTVYDNQFDKDRNAQFTQALAKYGYKDIKSFNTPIPYINAGLLPNTKHLKGHDNHLHLQGFSPTMNLIDEPCE